VPVEEKSVSRISISIPVLIAVLSLNPLSASGQTVQTDHVPAQTGTDATKSDDTEVKEGVDHIVQEGDDRPANPPVKDETVGLGSSVDRAPRDIREPFDE
jgi:hypothetical protein